MSNAQRKFTRVPCHGMEVVDKIKGEVIRLQGGEVARSPVGSDWQLDVKFYFIFLIWLIIS